MPYLIVSMQLRDAKKTNEFFLRLGATISEKLGNSGGEIARFAQLVMNSGQFLG